VAALDRGRDKQATRAEKNGVSTRQVSLHYCWATTSLIMNIAVAEVALTLLASRNSRLFRLSLHIAHKEQLVVIQKKVL
jgi:hypothetical protein